MTTTQAPIAQPMLTLDEMPWVDPPTLPPRDLPDSDGEPMESPWHVGSGLLLKEGYGAARGGGLMTDYYVGVNMCVYYSWQQVRNKEFKGPDMYFVHNVDGQKYRPYWAIWDEGGRYPDVVIEFLSPTTEREDLGSKREIYEQVFRVKEYFCIAPQVERILGWRSMDTGYVTLATDERGWIWSATLGLWIGAWQGRYSLEETIWPRFYHSDGSMVLIEAEAERERAEAEHERAAAAEAQLAQERERAASAEAEAAAERERTARAEAEAVAERERTASAEARIAQLEAQLRRLADDSARAS